MDDFHEVNAPSPFTQLYQAIVDSNSINLRKYLKQCTGKHQVGVCDANYTIPVVFRAIMNYNQSIYANRIAIIMVQYAKSNNLYDNKDYMYNGYTVKEYEASIMVTDYEITVTTYDN